MDRVKVIHSLPHVVSDNLNTWGMVLKRSTVYKVIGRILYGFVKYISKLFVNSLNICIYY